MKTDLGRLGRPVIRVRSRSRKDDWKVSYCGLDDSVTFSNLTVMCNFVISNLPMFIINNFYRFHMPGHNRGTALKRRGTCPGWPRLRAATDIRPVFINYHYRGSPLYYNAIFFCKKLIGILYFICNPLLHEDDQPISCTFIV